MKVLFGGKFVGDWSHDRGLLYEGKEIQINRGVVLPRRVVSTDLISSTRKEATHAILGRFVVIL